MRVTGRQTDRQTKERNQTDSRRTVESRQTNDNHRRTGSRQADRDDNKS